MNKDKVKLKYIMSLWKSLPDYPTKEDVIYELNIYMVKDGRPNGEFSLQTFNSLYGSDWETTKHHVTITKMFNDLDFIETKKSNASKRWYTIKENPYY